MMRSREYWQERFKELEQARHDFAEGVFTDIADLYAEIVRALEKDLAEWYQRFAEENHMSYADAKKLLNSRELHSFRLDLKTFIDKAKDENLSDAWKKKLENAYVRMRISRIEAIQLMLQQHLEELFAGQLDTLDSALKELYTNDYYHTAFTIQQGAGVGSTFVGVDTDKLDSVLSRPWADDGRNFSSRIWSHRDNLVGLLNKEMVQAVIRGDDYRTATNNIARKMNVSRANAGRLVMTEATFIGTRAQQECFKNLGVEEFEFVATLDKRTSEICRSMDGKHFKMSDMKIGTNAPPLHPHCRSCTAPYFDDAEDLERIARGEDGNTYKVPGDMTYEQWKGKYASSSGKPSVQNNSEHGIIKPTKVIAIHETIHRISAPNDIIDYIGTDGKVNNRVFYNENAVMYKQINPNDHGHPENHPYGEHGEHGEHVHIFEWLESGKLGQKFVRELTEEERKENGDIL